MNNIITIKNLIKKDILNDINLNIEEHDIIAIMGNSGAGKSTLLNIISGLDNATSGSVQLLGNEITSLREPQLTKFRSKNIAYIFQDYKLLDFLTVIENITLIQKTYHNKIDQEKLNNILNILGLTDLQKRKISQLSGGQKQRVAIARALVGDNKLIIADEPTGALDILNRNKIMDELILNTKNFKKTLIIVTHDPYVALRANKIIFLNNHQIESINDSKNLTEELIINKLESFNK